MKAIQFSSFGDSSVLKLNQAEKPSVKEDDVLVKISAATVNPIDMKIRAGYLQKILPTPFPYTPGSDIAGVVESVGSKVTTFKKGDKVFGTNLGGTYAEYISINQGQIALMPSSVSFNEAAALAVPLVTSYTLLVENAHVKAGQKILIHGAGGAVGSVMLQMAKSLGAYVVGTGTGTALSQIKQFGADETIDYKTQDFTTLVKDVDLVADLVGGETQSRSFQVIKKGGQLISIVMPPSPELAEKAGVSAKFINSIPSSKKLEYGKGLVEHGKIKIHIVKTLKLEKAAEAQDLVSNGGVNGKVVLEIE